jgi:hypothetical protein
MTIIIKNNSSFWLSLLFFVCAAVSCGMDDCRYDPNCGMYREEPYSVEYTFPREYGWDYLKDFTGDRTALRVIPKEEVWEQEPGVVFNFSDCFDYTRRIYSYSRHIEDDEGNIHRLNIEWSGHFQRRRRLFAGRRVYTNFLRVTVDDRLLMFVDDEVRPGRYRYRDYFSLGEKRYRLTMDMTSETFDYYCLVVLLESPPY